MPKYSMKKLKYPKLVKLLLILLNVLLSLFILKECKIIGFCCTVINLILPVLFGFVIAWLLKPIMFYFERYFKTLPSTIITYFIIFIIIFLVGYFLIPIVIGEIKNLIPNIIDLYNNLPEKITNRINYNSTIKRALLFINNCGDNVKNICLNIFYSVIISFYFVLGNKSVSKFILKYLPSTLINNISVNLKGFVRGTLIDMFLLFIITLISFFIANMPYPLLFAIIISLTNVIPYIGPYIGGIPAVIVGLSVGLKLGIIILVLIVVLQFIESSILNPLIMSKCINIHPIIIILGIIIFGHFFGIIGMLISTPIITVLKTIYEYKKEHPFRIALDR